jgi:hypothetical protein
LDADFLRVVLVYDVKISQLGRKNLAVRFDTDQIGGGENNCQNPAGNNLEKGVDGVAGRVPRACLPGPSPRTVVEPIVNGTRSCGCWFDTGASLRGNFEGRRTHLIKINA